MAPDVAKLVSELQTAAADSSKLGDESQRQNLLQAARNLVNELEAPSEKVRHMCYAEPLTFAATRTLADLKVFNILVESNGPQSVTQLAQTTGADTKLFSRLLKQVASESLIKESAPDEYVANERTKVLASPGGDGTVKDIFRTVTSAAELPAFLKRTNYANPIDKDRSPWKSANNTDLHYFDYIFTPGREDMVEAFKNHMTTKTEGGKWFEDQAVMKGIFGNDKLSSEDVLLIDVGGNSGHDILGFKKAHSDMTGRLILQDLPAIISSLDSSGLAAQGVETMPHDMFTPQPVVNAKAYYSKMVLHDWPDEQCKQALANLKPALKRGYSRILLNELVIPDMNAHWFQTSVDLLMMAVHSAQERRENEWRALVESVDGLKVTKFWNVEGALEQIIEIELA